MDTIHFSIDFNNPERGTKSTAAVCVYPPFVAQAKQLVGNKGIYVASVAGAFPAGQSPIEVKIAEVKYAVAQGADEIDMVISRGKFLEGNYQEVFDEIVAIKQAAHPAHLKVILETGELKSADNIFRASQLAIAAGADFIKTSTGKIGKGASLEAAYVMSTAIKEFNEIKEENKIEVTRKKTQKKKEALAAQEEEIRRKTEFRSMKDKELERKREQNKMQKENNRNAIQAKREERKKQVEEDAKMMKDQKKNNYEMKKYMEAEDTTNKKTQADYIKSQQIIAEEKRRAIELERKNQVRADLERKIQEEEERIYNANNKKQSLEEEEIVIMNKLKRTTQMHENMEKDLENLSNSKKKI